MPSLRSAILRGALAFACPLLLPATAAAQDGLKVYISADMEGVVGVVTSDHLGPTGFEYQKAREWLTDEVNAAIRAARAAGAGEIVVSDSHGNGENILLDRIPRGVKLNGVEVPEAVINAAIAGHFGVPVVMISGDDAIVREARSHLGDLEGAVLKWNYGFHSAMTVTPAESQEIIAESVSAALGRLDRFRPFVLETPVKVEVSFKNYLAAELLAYLPMADRVDSHTISFTGQDMVEVSKFFSFITRYRPDITP